MSVCYPRCALSNAAEIHDARCKNGPKEWTMWGDLRITSIRRANESSAQPRRCYGWYKGDVCDFSEETPLHNMTTATLCKLHKKLPSFGLGGHGLARCAFVSPNTDKKCLGVDGHCGPHWWYGNAPIHAHGPLCNPTARKYERERQEAIQLAENVRAWAAVEAAGTESNPHVCRTTDESVELMKHVYATSSPEWWAQFNKAPEPGRTEVQ